MLAQIEARIRKLEERRAARSEGVVIIFYPSDLPPEEAEAFVEARKAEAPGKMPLIIRFVGPPGGPEEGTGFPDPDDYAEPSEGE